MTLPALNLDDLTYQQLVTILRGHLPGNDWSDHNPSDPGIALLELLCWLGEMDLYRMNRVPASHRDKLLKLLVDPPVPVTVTVTLRLDPPRAPGSEDLVIPPGLRAASNFRGGRRTVFETFARARLGTPAPGKDQVGEIVMRAVRDVGPVVLGTSTGAPDQTFALPAGPVLIDLGARGGGYDPNPRVSVNGVAWELRPFLLTADARATAGTAPACFMVDDAEGVVRFGDGAFGAIPPAGAVITLDTCQVLEGPEALVAEGEVRHLLNPQIVADLAAGEALRLLVPEDFVGDRAGRPSTDAQGGDNFFAPSERLQRGLADFRNPSRLITIADFERVATDDFNRFQERFNLTVGRPPERDLVARAVALMNRKPPLVDAQTSAAAGHVTLLILPRFDEDAFDAATVAGKAALATPSDGLAQRLVAFLEPHRLITTRLHVVGPRFASISGTVVVVVESQRNTAQMEAAVLAALRAYLSLIDGYDDGGGWPLGRAVRRSQLYRLLEDLAGVDHVESLTLSPADPQGDVPLAAGQLPLWDNLVVQIKRA